MSDVEKNLYSDGQRYDLVMGRYASGSLLEFYRRQVARYREPVLELACGTGRLTIPLAADGSDITGLDISEHMLALAELKASERAVHPAFVQGDVRAFDLNRKFQLIFLAAQSLSHLHTLDEIRACLARVRQHLAKDGRFLIELHNPSLTLLSRQAGARYAVGEYEDGNEQVFLSETVSYDAATQVNHIRWYFQREGAEEEIVLSFRMRQFFPQEIDGLLACNGYLIEQKYGDYDETPFSSASQRQLIVCRAN